MEEDAASDSDNANVSMASATAPIEPSVVTASVEAAAPAALDSVDGVTNTDAVPGLVFTNLGLSKNSGGISLRQRAQRRR